MTTRAARIWNGTAWEDLAAPVGVAPVSYQSTQPSSPQTGDIWIDSSTNTASSGIPVNYQATAPVNPSIGTIWIESDIDVPSVGQNLSYRWRRIAGGGETTLSGNDSFGLPLTYTPGYEQFFLNGMLLYRDSDYTASTGTTITGFPALAAGDVIEVLAIKAEPLADTYTQAQSDSKYFTRQTGTSSGEASTVNINTKPWNMPWGLVGYATRSTSTASITTETTAVSVTFTAVAGRNYRINYYEPLIQASGGSYMQFKIRSDNTSGTVHQRADVEPVSYTSFDGQIMDLKIIKQLTAGSNTLVGTIQGVGAGVVGYANVSLSVYAYISVEDMGPA